MSGDREKLVELIDEKQVYGIDQKQPRKLELLLLDNDELADHLLANGVIVLPCKVGDTVWAIKRYGGKPIAIIEDKVQMVGVTSRSVRILLRAHKDHNQTFMLGKTVFLTPEEAEAALKEGQ